MDGQERRKTDDGEGSFVGREACMFQIFRKHLLSLNVLGVLCSHSNSR